MGAGNTGKVESRVDPKADGLIAVAPELAMVFFVLKISPNENMSTNQYRVAELSDCSAEALPDAPAKHTWPSRSEAGDTMSSTIGMPCA